MPIPTPSDVERKLEAEDLDEWLALWQAEQGPAKPAALALLASAIPAAPDASLRVLDLCCGPGDVGRAIHAHFANAGVDAVDRDVFLASLCKLANRKAGVAGRTLIRDLEQPDWRGGLETGYDAVAVGNALHWFTPTGMRALVKDAFELLRPGGVFVFLEPVSSPAAIAAGVGAWRAAQPPQHRREDWLALWSRVNAFLGYDHMNLKGRPPAGRVGDGLTAVEWAHVAEAAGFDPVDVLLRDPEKVVVAALKPG